MPYQDYIGDNQEILDIETGNRTIIYRSPESLQAPNWTSDGKYIYFNSNRSGTMQIWRMKPDGSEQQQITSDEFNNWFPHISPDGKWILFLFYI